MIQTRARATFEGVPADRPAVTLRSPLVRFWSLRLPTTGHVLKTCLGALWESDLRVADRDR